jgi:hypothetical protein
MTDNGAANVIMIEMARIFQKHQKELERGVKLAWWSGHSTVNTPVQISILTNTGRTFTTIAWPYQC